MMHKKRWAAFVLAAALVLTGCSAGSFLHFGKGSGGSTVQKIDRPAVESAELQFAHPAAGDTIAVFDTSAGVFKAVLFPDKAPQAYDNFAGLVQAGYYNGLRPPTACTTTLARCVWAPMLPASAPAFFT